MSMYAGANGRLTDSALSGNQTNGTTAFRYVLYRHHYPFPPSCLISSVVIRRHRCRILGCTPGS